MSCPLDDLIAASAPRDVPSVVLDGGAGGASLYDGESLSLPATGGLLYPMYSIIVIERPESHCRGLLKNNESACIKHKHQCHSSHRGDGQLNLSGPTIAVLSRHKETVFSVPILNATFVDDSLLNDWMETKKTKLEWNKCFDVVRYLFHDPNKPISLEDFNRQCTTQAQAKLALKTPAKPKSRLFPVDIAEDEGIQFTPIVKLEKNTTGNTEETIEDQLKRIEAYLLEDGLANEERWEALKEVLRESSSTSKYHTTQINAIDTIIGVRNPRSFPTAFDGTDLWSTVGSIGQALLEIAPTSEETLISRVSKRCADDLSERFTDTDKFNRFVNHLTSWFATYHDNKAAVWAKLQLLESRANNNSGQFFNQFQGVHSSFMHQPTYQQQGNNAALGPTLKEHRDLKDEVESLKAMIVKLSLEKDQSSISFGSLGFVAVDDARAFVSEHPEAKNFGLIIDPYAVCYHVMKDNKGHSKFFDRLHHIKKLGIGTNREAIVMHGFNSPIPELFDDSGDQQSSPYVSSFGKFPTHKDWVDKGKKQIPASITLVRSQLNIHADNFLKPGSKVHTICKLSISESCAAMEKFCTWLDNSHNNLVTYGMSKDKAWILTTKLGERVFRELFVVRSGVADGFNVCGEDASKVDIAANIWFYVPKTLDVLKTFVDADFGDHESIASEYIRFLVHNTNSAEVSTFEANINEIKEGLNVSKKHWDKEFKSVKSAFDSANKAATTYNNKLTEHTKKLKEWASGQFASK